VHRITVVGPQHNDNWTAAIITTDIFVVEQQFLHQEEYQHQRRRRKPTF
jgi:hypothetical protein